MPLPRQPNDDTVYWTNALLHTAVRAVVLYPIVRFVGGVGGARAVATAVLASSACTAGQIVYQRTRLPRLPLQGPQLVPQVNQPTIIPGVVIDAPPIEGS